MKVEWANRASISFSKIQSVYFSPQETAQYKLQLLQQIHDKIVRTGLLFQSKNYKNTYYIRIDKYIISYEPSEDRTKYTVTAFKHGKQKKAH